MRIDRSRKSCPRTSKSWRFDQWEIFSGSQINKGWFLMLLVCLGMDFILHQIFSFFSNDKPLKEKNKEDKIALSWVQAFCFNTMVKTADLSLLVTKATDLNVFLTNIFETCPSVSCCALYAGNSDLIVLNQSHSPATTIKLKSWLTKMLYHDALHWWQSHHFTLWHWNRVIAVRGSQLMHWHLRATVRRSFFVGSRKRSRLPESLSCGSRLHIGNLYLHT